MLKVFAQQIVMTRNKEAILSEKDLSCHLGQTCLVGYAKPIDPSQFSSFEEFVASVQTAWDAEWKRVYTADLSGELCREILKSHSAQAWRKAIWRLS